MQTKKVLMAALAAIGITTASAQAAVIGVNPNGTGPGGGYTPTDLWTNATDSALAVGFNPALLFPVGSPLAYDIRLIAQARVAAFQLNGAIVFPGGITPNLNYEVTKVLDINETVLSNTAPGPGLANANFGMATQTADVDLSTPGLQQLAIYFDIPITDGSTAVPGNGFGTVRCYGTGPTSTPSGLCGVAGADGILVASAHLISNTGSFAAAAGGTTGTGSFDLQFVFDFINPAFLDVITGSVFGEKITGTTNVPTQFTPDSMWNGVATAGNILLKVDSSQSFVAQVPEPGSLALLGLGLVGLVGFSRRRWTNSPA